MLLHRRALWQVASPPNGQVDCEFVETPTASGIIAIVPAKLSLPASSNDEALPWLELVGVDVGAKGVPAGLSGFVGNEVNDDVRRNVLCCSERLHGAFGIDADGFMAFARGWWRFEASGGCKESRGPCEGVVPCLVIAIGVSIAREHETIDKG